MLELHRLVCDAFRATSRSKKNESEVNEKPGRLAAHTPEYLEAPCRFLRKISGPGYSDLNMPNAKASGSSSNMIFPFSSVASSLAM